MIDVQANHLKEMTTAPKKILWGVAPTGEPHFGYILPVYILKHFQEYGTEVIPLVANWHGYLDSEKTQWDCIESRTAFYKNWFKQVGFPNVIETNDFYNKPEYLALLIKTAPYFDLAGLIASGKTTLKNEGQNSSAADVYYIQTQIIDPLFLDIDSVLSAVDEAPIYAYGIEVLKNKTGLDYRGIYCALSPGIVSSEMHSSAGVKEKIMLSDTPETLTRKLERHLDFHKTQVANSPFYLFIKSDIAPYVRNTEILSQIDLIQYDPSGNTLENLLKLFLLIFKDVQGIDEYS